jgi:hypothetical protein
MLTPLRRFLSVTLLVSLVATSPAFALSADDAGDLVRAQKLITKVLKIVEKYQAANLVLAAPAPRAGNGGKYLLPYKADGELTDWAAKIVNIAASKVVGEKVGEKATEAVASKIPFGGLAGGLIKKKSKEVTAVAFLGGTEFIKSHSDQSFDNLADYAVYLQARHGNTANFQQALAAAMALYPDLESGFENAVKQAYAAQAKKTG